MVGLGGRGPRLTSLFSHSSFLAISLFLQLHYSAIYLIHSISPIIQFLYSYNHSLFLIYQLCLSFLLLLYFIPYISTNHNSIFPHISHSTILYLLYSLLILHSLYFISVHSMHLIHNKRHRITNIKLPNTFLQ